MHGTDSQNKLQRKLVIMLYFFLFFFSFLFFFCPFYNMIIFYFSEIIWQAQSTIIMQNLFLSIFKMSVTAAAIFAWKYAVWQLSQNYPTVLPNIHVYIFVLKIHNHFKSDMHYIRCFGTNQSQCTYNIFYRKFS